MRKADRMIRSDSTRSAAVRPPQGGKRKRDRRTPKERRD